MVYSNKYKFRKLRGTVQDSINEERARQNEDFNRKLKNAEDSMKAIYPEEYKKIRSRYFGNGNNLGLIGSQFNYIHDMITRRSDDQMKKYYNELNDYFIKQTGTEPGYMLQGVDVVAEAPDWAALRQKDFDRFYSPTENSDYLNSVEKQNAENAYWALQNKNADGTFDHDGYFDYNPNNGLLNTEANYARATGSYNYTPEERVAAATWERAQNSPIVTAMEFSPLFPVVAGIKAVAAANAPQASGVDVGMNAAFAALPAIGVGAKAINNTRKLIGKQPRTTQLGLNKVSMPSNNIEEIEWLDMENPQTYVENSIPIDDKIVAQFKIHGYQYIPQEYRRVEKGISGLAREHLDKSTIDRNLYYLKKQKGLDTNGENNLKDFANKLLDDIEVGKYSGEDYKLAGEEKTGGFYDPTTNFISINKDSGYKDYEALGHEGRHMLDYKFPYSVTGEQREILNKAFDEDFKRLPNNVDKDNFLYKYPSIEKEAVTTNFDARRKLLGDQILNKPIELQNDIIDKISDHEIINAIANSNRYGKEYIKYLMENNKLTQQKIKQFREAMKWVGALSIPVGFGIGSSNLVNNNNDEQQYYKSGGIYNNRKRGNERQRNEFEQMSVSRNAALPKSEVVNADNTHEWKRTHWGEYDKAPTGNKMYGDVYTINNPESYERKKRVELKRQIREEFPDAKIKYDNGSISFRVPYVNEDHVNLSLKSDDYYTPEINTPVVRIKRMPQMREFEIRQPKSNLWWWTNDNGTVNFVHGDHNNDYYRHPEYNIEVEGIDYNQAYDNSMPEFMDIAYDKEKNVYVYNGNRWINHYYNSDVAYGKKAKNNYITAQDLINNGYKIFKYPEQYKNSSIYQKEKNELQKYFDKIELLNKVNKESKLHNEAFGYEPQQQVYNNGGVLDATYMEQINRIRQQRFAGWRFKYGGIHIKESHEGKFTEAANRAGMGVQEYARHILANKENYSPTMVKRANFARNARKWKHADGGDVPPFKSFDDWYRSIYHNANDTTDYNLRRAYELAHIGELEAWRSDPDKNHLHTGYWNGDVYEFMKSKDHPTVNYELDWYNSPDADDFRSRYMLDTTTGNYKYVPRYRVKVTF